MLTVDRLSGVTSVVPLAVRSLPAGHRDVGRQPARRGLLVGDPPGQPILEHLHALPGHRRDREHVGPAQAFAVQQSPEVGQALFPLGRRQPVRLVERDHHHAGVLGEGDQVTVVQRRVGVLLRVDHPDQHVDQLHQPIDLHPVLPLGGVVVRQVEQDQPVQRLGRLRVPLQRMSPGDLQPVQ